MKQLLQLLTALALMITGVEAVAQYNPTNPPEPGVTYTLALRCEPAAAGSFNISATSTHSADESISLYAYSNNDFRFEGWVDNGEIVSTSYSYRYKMPAHNATLTARYVYDPANPDEPSQPITPEWSILSLKVSPAGAGSLNQSSGNRYEVGTSVYLDAYNNSDYIFRNWTDATGNVISTSPWFSYTVPAGNPQLTANFEYSPLNPEEPEAPQLKHKLNLRCNPPAAGYFNQNSGNSYTTGNSVWLVAYANQYYTFRNWTDADGNVVSTNYAFYYTTIDSDMTLTANYTYEYNPSNPDEPSQQPGERLSLYGMTETAYPGQTIPYPVYLDNNVEVTGIVIDAQFPDGFTVDPDGITASSRAAAHTLTAAAIEGETNAWRISLTGSDLIAGNNGKVLEIPVTVPQTIEESGSYTVVLTHGVAYLPDGATRAIGVRQGSIAVEPAKEDGLFAQFSYDKSFDRVQFTNSSADKAVRFLWDFGDGNSSTDRDPMHTYAEPGSYTVTLTAYGSISFDKAEMTVMVSDPSTWHASGTYFLDTGVSSVRSYTDLQSLLKMLSSTVTDGNITIRTHAGHDFPIDITDSNIALISGYIDKFADSGYLVSFIKDGDGNDPSLSFGSTSTPYPAGAFDTIRRMCMMQSMTGVAVKVSDMTVDFHAAAIEPQTVCSGELTAEIPFAAILPGNESLVTWTLDSDCDASVLTGVLTSGSGNIAPMEISNNTGAPIVLTYTAIIPLPSADAPEMAVSAGITVMPGLEGELTELLPADGATFESTDITFSWNPIDHATYRLYVWDTEAEAPQRPVWIGTDTSTLVRGICAEEHSYHWRVEAFNDCRTIVSDIRTFAVGSAPDLHISHLSVNGTIEAGARLTAEWAVTNDGAGSTGSTVWTDRLWLVDDIKLGTRAHTVHLLAELPRMSALAAGESYQAQADIKIPADIKGQWHLLAAADMAEVYSIDWNSVGGSVMDPYEPSADGTPYHYLYAVTPADGNLLAEKDETATRSDNFRYIGLDFYPIDESEWAVLQALYDNLGGSKWSPAWDMTIGRLNAHKLRGVTCEGGHVTMLNLSSMGLTGSANTALPDGAQLEQLDAIYIGNNKLTGNIGAFASHFPALTFLSAPGNRLSEINPKLQPAVSYDFNSQQIDATATTTIDGTIPAGLWTGAPSLFTYIYDTTGRSSVRLVDGIPTNAFLLDYLINVSAEGDVTIRSVGSTNLLKVADGATMYLCSDDQGISGSYMPTVITFLPGDASFDGVVDVTDLQAMILQILGNYDGSRPFNFTAADLYKDDNVNIQDVVNHVGLLLSADTSTHSKTRRMSAAAGSTGARIYVDGTDLVIDSDEPVAAFDVTLAAGASDWKLNRFGLSVNSRTQSGAIHAVAWSASGHSIPAGRTVIASVPSGSAVTEATLSSSDARKIPCLIEAGPAGATTPEAAAGLSAEWLPEGLRLTGISGRIDYSVADTSGRILASGHADAADGTYHYIAVPHVSAGILLVTVRADSFVRTLKVPVH